MSSSAEGDGCIFVGLDLSLQSPGIGIFDPREATLTLYFFPSRKRDVGVDCSLPVCLAAGSKWTEKLKGERSAKRDSDHLLVRVKAFSDCWLKGLDLHEKYEAVASRIVSTIQAFSERFGSKEKKKKACRIAIEGYSLGSNMPGTAKLRELGGIVKNRLFTAGFDFQEKPPTTVKKVFSGKGNATKEAMYRAWLSKGFPDIWKDEPFRLMTGLGGRERSGGTAGSGEQQEEDGGEKFARPTKPISVPTPIQDLVDAAALVETVFEGNLAAKPRKSAPSRRKRSAPTHPVEFAHPKRAKL